MIKKIELAPGIVVYKDVLPERKNFIEFLEEGALKNLFKWNKGSIINNDEYKSEDKTTDIVNTKIRDVEAFVIKYFGEIVKYEGDKFENFNNFKRHANNMIFKSLREAEMNYKEQFAINFDTHDAYQILKYGKGHFFDLHQDDSKSYPRRISFSYYLNDDYEGGEIEFPRFNLKIKAEAGDMLIFPSNYPYTHLVHEVTQGIRYTIVDWIH